MKKQNGYIYRRAGWWVLRYRENVLENGRIVRKQLAHKMEEIKPEHARLKRPPSDIEDVAEDFLRPLNRGGGNPQATQTIGQFAENLFFPLLEQQVRQSTLRGYRARWDIAVASTMRRRSSARFQCTFRTAGHRRRKPAESEDRSGVRSLT